MPWLHCRRYYVYLRLFRGTSGRSQCHPFRHHRHIHPYISRKIPLATPHTERRRRQGGISPLFLLLQLVTKLAGQLLYHLIIRMVYQAAYQASGTSPCVMAIWFQYFLFQCHAPRNPPCKCSRNSMAYSGSHFRQNQSTLSKPILAKILFMTRKTNVVSSKGKSSVA